MAVKVVDTSALAALLFGEPDGDQIVVRFGDADLVAPSLLQVELASVCLKKLRRHPEQAAALKAAFRLRRRLPIEERDVDHDEVLELAETSGLTAYDASYLWLARRLGAELVTLDRKLEQAAASQPER